MSSIKISQLPELPSIAANTSNTLFLGVDLPTAITGKFTATTLAQQLFANNALTVGNNIILFSNTVGQFSGYDPSFLQVNMQNFNANGSGDFVITGDKGTNSNNYIDLGLSGSNFQTNPTVGTAFLPNDGYLYVQGPGGAYVGNLLIGTGSTNTKILFASGGLNTENIVGYIDSTGLHFGNIDNEIAANLVAAMSYTNTKIVQVNSNAANLTSYAQAAFATANTANVTSTNLSGNVNILQSQLASNANAIVALTGYSQSAYATVNALVISSNTAALGIEVQAAFNAANNNANAINSLVVINGAQNNAINLAFQSSGGSITGYTTFANTYSSNTQALVEINSSGITNLNSLQQPVLLRLTGNSNNSTKILLEDYGTGIGNTYNLIAARAARGTVSSPSATQNNDILMRLAVNGYGTTQYQQTGTARIDFVAEENYTDSSKGSRIEFWNTAIGSNTLTRVATFNSNTAAFPGTITANNVTITGTVIANTFVGNTAFANVSVQNQVANTIQFYPQYVAPTQMAGQVWFDPSVNRLVLDTDTAGDRPGIGRVIYERVYNNTGSTIQQNSVVRLNGQTTANFIPYITLADATSYANSAVSGLILNPIANGAYGYVYIEGLMIGTNTSSFSTGDFLYLTATPGVLSNTAPPNGNLASLQVGKVVVADATNGKIRVETRNRLSANRTNGSVLFANNGFTLASNTLNINESISTVNVAGTLTANSVTINDSGILRYNAAAGNATVTQLTSKSTSVICNGRTGQITTNNASLAGGRSVTFTVNNNFIVSADDVVIVNIASGATTSTYAVSVTNINATGAFDITISNVSGSSAADALVINFAVIRVS